MQWVTVVPIFISSIMLLVALLTLRRTNTQDTSASATERATMTADIRYIRTSIDEIKLENRAIQKDVSDLKTKVVEIEASAKSAHKRLDDMVKKG